ncbi:ABC transporter ATP-binding protein [Paraburkholderia sp.]|uniref:ABC transporter ATP-binding protein n=1 Tax=Paraburkholderia sp. TaxID=1926495 RepID=UPI0023A22636|nr:ABC transporter ATP-binding protein [Paraburkholderia sp.]MDE1181873.1 ABC transporter ATP-binding protein [Paraburkholderia sp.]
MSTPLLSVRNLSIAFGEREIVHGIDFEIARGESVALVGESGSGKSLTAHALLALLPRSATVRGQIDFMGADLATASTARMQGIRGDRIGMIFQEPMTSLNPLHSVEKQVGEALLVHRGMSTRERRERVLELLRDVGIPEPESRLAALPHQLSGGQRQRVMIAMALACDPDLLIADEPTTALDVVVQSRIIDLLKALQAKRGLALLMISHDLNVVRRIADRVCVMREGHIVESAPCATLFAAPSHPYTRMLIDAEPDGAPSPRPDARPLLEADGLRVTFARKGGFMKRATPFTALDGVSFSLKAGMTLGIVGESGSGKSTLGQALLRLMPSEGEIRFDGTRLDGLNTRQMRPWRKHVQIVFQDPFGSLSPHMSVTEIVGEGLKEQATLDAAAIDREVIRALEDVGLDPATRYRFPHEFSGGQRQRIAIARALILRPQVIVMDEPTSALDRTVQKQVVGLLRDLQDRYGLAYLFISHDLAVVRALAHDVIVLQHGRIVESGAAATVLSSPAHAYTRELLAASSLVPFAVPETPVSRQGARVERYDVMRQ